MSGVLHGLLAALKTAVAAVGWDLSAATFTPQWEALNLLLDEATPTSMWMKNDGTKLYILGSSDKEVNEYNLSTPWLISTATWSQSFSVSAQDTNPHGICFDPNGTRMYVVGVITQTVYQYSLSNQWDISSATYTGNSFSVATQETVPLGVFLKPDGTKMYVIGSISDNVLEYNLSTAWDVTTASFLQSFSVVTQETNPNDIFFKADGTEMYVIGDAGNDINQYTLSTPWDISTASYTANFVVSDQLQTPYGFFFKPDGTQFFATGRTPTSACYGYTLGTAWAINTASFAYPTSDWYSVGLQEAIPSGITFKPDGTKMYVIGTAADKIFEYDLSTPWAIQTASFTASSPYIAGEDSLSNDLFFKPDGTAVYTIGAQFDNVYAYSLSTPWDVTTLTYTGNSFSVAAQETSPNGLFFKPDGTVMYVVGASSDTVYQYTLTSAWDITTAVLASSFSVSAQDSTPASLFFKPDGSKMFVVGSGFDRVYEYALSTAWAVASASFVTNFSVSLYEITPTGISFKTNGTKMYIVGTTSDAVWAFDL